MASTAFSIYTMPKSRGTPPLALQQPALTTNAMQRPCVYPALLTPAIWFVTPQRLPMD